MSVKFGKTIRTLRLSQNYLVLIKKVYLTWLLIITKLKYNTNLKIYNAKIN